MSFGWYQELLREVRAECLCAAEARLLDMLDEGAMIVHVYRETDPENPELVGRHRQLRSFVGSAGAESVTPGELPHEVERFLLDSASLDAWAGAIKTDRLLEGRWSIVEFWPPPDAQSSADLSSQDFSFPIYGKAILLDPATTGRPPVAAPPDRPGRQLE